MVHGLGGGKDLRLVLGDDERTASLLFDHEMEQKKKHQAPQSGLAQAAAAAGAAAGTPATLPPEVCRLRELAGPSPHNDEDDGKCPVSPVEEQDIPGAIFNDPESSSEQELIRTLTDFYFCTRDGQPIELDVLERPSAERPELMGFGTLVQPLRAAEIDRICLASVTSSSSMNQLKRSNEEALLDSHNDNDDDDTTTTTKASKQMKLDRPAENTSETITPLSSSSSLEEQLNDGHSGNSNISVSEDQLDLLESRFIYTEHSPRNQRIVLRGISDWCLDYSPGNPTLWIITPEAWYKIAGPLSGVFPHSSYRPSFDRPRRMFEAAFQAAQVLKDRIHPSRSKRKLSYRQTMLEILDQSQMSGRYGLTEAFLVEHYPFLVSQIIDLEKDDVTSEAPDSSRSSTMFFQNLKRLHEFYLIRKSREEDKLSRRLEREAQWKTQKEERLKRLEAEKVQRRMEMAAKKAYDAKYPMEDLALLTEEYGDKAASHPKRPESTIYSPLKSPQSCPPHVLGDVVMMWQIFQTFFSHDPTHDDQSMEETASEASQESNDDSTLPSETNEPVSLIHSIMISGWTFEDLVECLVAEKNPSSSQSSTNEKVTLEQLVMSFLSIILSSSRSSASTEDENNGSIPTKEYQRISILNDPLIQQVMSEYGIEPSTFSFAETSDDLPFPPVTIWSWPEILRQLMIIDSNRSGAAASSDDSGSGYAALIGYHQDPLPYCQIVLQILLVQKTSHPESLSHELEQAFLNIQSELRLMNSLPSPSSSSQSLSFILMERKEKFTQDIRTILSSPTLPMMDNDIKEDHCATKEAQEKQRLLVLFEAEFDRIVSGPLAQNSRQMEKALPELKQKCVAEDPQSVNNVDADFRNIYQVIRYLTVLRVDEWPIEIKVQSLVWCCHEFLQLESTRKVIDDRLTTASELIKQQREDEKEDRRKRRMQNAVSTTDENSSDTEETNEEEGAHDAEKDDEAEESDENEVDQDEKNSDEEDENEEQELEHEIQLRQLKWEKEMMKSGCVYQFSIGEDRYHNRYWSLYWCTCYEAFDSHEEERPNNEEEERPMEQRFFIEDFRSGEFYQYAFNNEEELRSLRKWLNPKGIRESKLIQALEAIKPLNPGDSKPLRDNYTNTRAPQDQSSTIEVLSAFGSFATHTIPLKTVHGHYQPFPILREMVAEIENRLMVHSSSSLSQEANDILWTPKKDLSCCIALGDFIDYVGALEEHISKSTRFPDILFQYKWKHDNLRSMWRMQLQSCFTPSQLSTVVYRLMDEMLDEDACIDILYSPFHDEAGAGRKKWVKCRQKEQRLSGSYLPSVGQEMVYFGPGHAEAIHTDSTVYSSPSNFVWPGDLPVLTTAFVRVTHMSYHAGAGDPYCRVTLSSLDDQDPPASEPTSYSICSPSSAAQQFGRIVLRIVAKMKSDRDAQPFLELVNEDEYPDYYQLIGTPVSLLTMETKARASGYEDIDAFLAEVLLLVSNCRLYCQEDFPELIPMAERLQEIALYQTKKMYRDISAVNDDRAQDPQHLKKNNSTNEELSVPSTFVVVLRLENRLRPFLIDRKVYQDAVSTKFTSGTSFRLNMYDEHGYPLSSSSSEQEGGVLIGSTPFLTNGLLPWEALQFCYEKLDDGSQNQFINPWEIQAVVDTSTRDSKPHRRRSRKR